MSSRAPHPDLAGCLHASLGMSGATRPALICKRALACRRVPANDQSARPAHCRLVGCELGDMVADAVTLLKLAERVTGRQPHLENGRVRTRLHDVE